MVVVAAAAAAAGDVLGSSRAVYDANGLDVNAREVTLGRVRGRVGAAVAVCAGHFLIVATVVVIVAIKASRLIYGDEAGAEQLIVGQVARLIRPSAAKQARQVGGRRRGRLRGRQSARCWQRERAAAVQVSAHRRASQTDAGQR